MPPLNGTIAYTDDGEKKKKLQVIKRDKKVRVGKPLDPKVKAKLQNNLAKARLARNKSKKPCLNLPNMER